MNNLARMSEGMFALFAFLAKKRPRLISLAKKRPSSDLQQK
jgi:hypothetical protein